MNLFDNEKIDNILSYDGAVCYYGRILVQNVASRYFESLLNTLDWRNDEAVMFGKHIVTKRKVAWYGDDNYSYTYSKTTKQALSWTEDLLNLRKIIEEYTDASYNSCLANLYHNGEEGMAWHSDDEKSLSKNSCIASLSFGAERKFSFKHKRTQEVVSLLLQSGSLLVMKGATQTNWLHRLPPVKKITAPRVNLTFRTMVS